MALSALARRRAEPTLVIVTEDREAEELAEDISLFCQEVVSIPAWETLPFERLSPSLSTMSRRCRALHALSDPKPGLVLVASVRSATQRLSPSDPAPLVVTQGQSIGLGTVVATLTGLGFERVARVEAPGEMAVRGGIVDVYPAAAGPPTRLDFWGEEIDEIRFFSPSSQRSEGVGRRAVFYPAREFRTDSRIAARAAELVSVQPWAAPQWERLAQGEIFEGMESWMTWLAPPECLLDRVGPGTLVVVADPPRSVGRSRHLLSEEEELAGELAATWSEMAGPGEESPRLYQSLEKALGNRSILEMPSVPMGPADEVLTVRGLGAIPGNGPSIAAALSGLRSEKVRVVVAIEGAASADRWARVLAEEGLVLPRGECLTNEGAVIISRGIRRGFVLKSQGVAVVGERELAGRRRAHRPAAGKRRSAVGVRDLAPGDYVVHYQHGIGRFEGLVSETMAGVERDYLLVAYAGDDRLYVPVDQLSLITRYTGGEAPRLSRMGGKDWAAVRQRVRNEVAVVAEEVVNLHRARSAAPGYGFFSRHTLATGDGIGISLQGDRRPMGGDLRRESGYGVEPADGSPDLRRRRVWQDRGGGSSRIQGSDGPKTGGGLVSHHHLGPTTSPDLLRAPVPARSRGGGAIPISHSRSGSPGGGPVGLGRGGCGGGDPPAAVKGCPVQ